MANLASGPPGPPGPPGTPDRGPFSPDELIRYGRHLSLSEVGTAGQERLRGARVVVVGLGGLGSPAAQYLVAAGVGTLGLIDGDRVELSNLQRQVLYGDADVGRPKVDAAAERLAGMNRHVRLEKHAVRLTSANALDVLRSYDLIVDGSDNFPTRYLVNDASVLLGIPNVHGSVLRFEGRVSVFGTANGPCYRCLYPTPPPAGVVPDCSEAGVLGVLPGLIGVLQAAEAIKLICGVGDAMIGRLLLIDATRPRFHSVAIGRQSGCPACGTREIKVLEDYEVFCGVAPTIPAVEHDVPTTRAVEHDAPTTRAVEHVAPDALAPRLHPGLQLLDVREPWEWEICRLPGAQLVPLRQLDLVTPRLDPARETIVYCHHGTRSLDAALRLREAGFHRVGHLAGGIDRWSIEIDPDVARY